MTGYSRKENPYFFFSCALAVLLLAACPATPKVPNESSDSEIADAFIFAAANEQDIATDYDFGTVTIGNPQLHTFTLKDFSHELSQIDIVTTEPFSIVNNGCKQYGPSDSECTFTVEFSPSSEGNFAAKIVGTQSGKRWKRNIKGTAVKQAELAFSQLSSLGDFGSLYKNSTLTSSFEIENKGTKAATSIQVLIDAPFSIVTNNCSGDLPGNQSCNFSLRFSPTAARDYSGELKITYFNGNSRAAVTLEKTLTGRGIIAHQFITGNVSALQSGTYGTKGVPANSNTPGGRWVGVNATDSHGNLWLFGGQVNNGGTAWWLNDLWKFDGTNWTWVAGTTSLSSTGVYGTKGVAASTNMPGGRSAAALWIDSSDNIWVFGGSGYDAFGNRGHLNDLWKFDGTNWTWVSGSNQKFPSGNYGSKGVANATNVPAPRMTSGYWSDNAGMFWLFGGETYDLTTGAGKTYNDLWKFDGTNWTWVSGSNSLNDVGNYGTKGITANTNSPSSRAEFSFQRDSAGNTWIFGGRRYSSGGPFNDLWKFDGTNWTWVSGANTVAGHGTNDAASSFGTRGVPESSNIPGGRYFSSMMVDTNNHVWVFGGEGSDSRNNGQYNLNDLWEFDGVNWAWVSGDKNGAPTLPYTSIESVPGSRSGSFSWSANGKLWLFGGFSSGLWSQNDLWSITP